MSGNDDFPLHSRGDFFPPSSKPRKVKGGIRAQTAKGRAFGERWWSRRWIAALEAMGVGGRLQRARTYARGGQVISVEVELGRIVAQVQGTRATPYDVEVTVQQVAQREWAALAAELGGEALYAARLLAGEMPDDIDARFARVGLSLFPRPSAELTARCSCPDWERFCKHVAAVCLIVGEQLDRDPFLMFRLRGVEREVLLAMIAGEAARRAGQADWEEVAAPAGGGTRELPADPAQFWGPAADPPERPARIEPPAFDAPLVRRLGPPPMWRGQDDFVPAMEKVARAAARL